MNACKKNGQVGSKLKRNWALNFMQTLNPNGDSSFEFKVITVEASGETLNDQVYFSSVDEKKEFVKFCEDHSISISNFFRTCEQNYILTGNPAGKH